MLDIKSRHFALYRSIALSRLAGLLRVEARGVAASATSSEALEFATACAKMKQGRVVILFNLCWYEFHADAVDRATGLVLCRLTKRDEEQYQEARSIFKKEGVDMWIEPMVKEPPKWTITPYLGQEVGFIVPSDSQNNMRKMEWTHVEFGTSVISHFRMPKDHALKVFVTAAYAGRIIQVGAAVFGCHRSLQTDPPRVTSN